MTEREIHPPQWRQFCDRFTQQHRGWPVSVDVLPTDEAGERARPEPGRAARDIAHGDPLDALTAVPNPHGTSLLLQIGYDSQTTRVLVDQPVRVRLQQTEGGAHAGLSIDAANGQTTRLVFQAAVPPA
jgi:hypothetical protein